MPDTIIFFIFFLLPSNLFSLKSCLPNVITFHTFGDSHSHWTLSILEKINASCILKTHSFYGKTLFGATKSDFIQNISFVSNNIEKNSIVMFNFGEVDSRNHLHRFRNTGLDLEIQRLVRAYENLILSNSILVPNIHIWIGGLVPPTENPKTDYLGSNDERKYYNQALNDEIYRMAKKNNFFYIDNYQDYVNERGFLRFNISDGHIHIGPKHFTENTKFAIANEVLRIFCRK